MARDPDEKVPMGRVVAPWGVKGWVKVEPYSDERDNLCGFRNWLLEKRGKLQPVAVAECKVHGAHVVARFEGCDDRDQAETWRGAQVMLRRGELPPPEPNEVYQADLIGLTVLGANGERLGRIVEILENPGNPVLRVAGEDRERLVPFVPPVIRAVDVEGGVVELEWGADW
ncbi:MAG TPA: ribosome maturation factor RimM [Burkholderiales bacterium]|nr:ribosome maturation factor RimM [Burkholderiales bacterium]